MFDTRRMTERSRHVMVLAEAQAKRVRSVDLQPEHVLLGLAEEGAGVAANVLRRLGAVFEQLKSAFDAIVLVGNANQCDSAPSSERAEQLIVRAYDEALLLNHNYIGTEHLALAISQETDGLVPLLLAACSVDPKEVRRETYNLLGHGDLAALV